VAAVISAPSAAEHHRAPALRRSPAALVLRAPGTNCDRETAFACELAGARPERVHLEALLAGEWDLEAFGLLILPGGFAYADHLGAGTIWAHRLDGLRERLARYVDSGRPVLGICNGFQALLKLGLLRGGALAPNRSGHFECRWVWLQNTARADNPLLHGLERLALPVANGEGRFVAESPECLSGLRRSGEAALVYTVPSGGPAAYPSDPSGSDGALAGLANQAGNVLGLMPHPERNLRTGDAPRGRPTGCGLAIFENAVALARAS
jgi:phosphoribosylformylglycinamidine synthase